MSTHVPYPKFEFSDLLYTRAVVPGHDFQPREDGVCYNLVRCERCGLDGWLAWEGPINDRKDVVKSYKPSQACTS